MKKNLLTFLFSFFCFLAAQSQIVISEIMYNPPELGDDTLSYIELHNTSDVMVNLNGYSFTDGINYTFPNITIAEGGYLVIAKDSTEFVAAFAGVTPRQWTSGSLTNSGEIIVLKDASNNTVDSVDYDDGGVWPVAADGNGASLELCDVLKDNALGENWKAGTNPTGAIKNGIEILGTPGAANTAFCADIRVEVSSNKFTPRDIEIFEGQTVLWENVGGFHNVNGTTTTYPSNPESFGNGGASSSNWTYEFTFTMPGVYEYQCDPHAGLDMKGTVTVKPKVSADLVISEFMYNDPSGSDSLEFIEIYNHGASAADLEGYVFTNGVTFTFPSYNLEAGAYVIVAKDSMVFKSVTGVDALQWTSGALNNSGESISIQNPFGDIVDELTYTDKLPWPVQADGDGNSVVLCDLDADNSDANNWQAATNDLGIMVEGSALLADPGAASTCSSTEITYPVRSIGEMTMVNAEGVADSLNQRAQLQGIVYGVNLRPSGLQFTLIDDANDGIAVFSSSEQFGYTVQEGDEIIIKGVISQFSGLTQVQPDSLMLVALGKPLQIPTIVTSLSEATESQLVTFENATLVDASEWSTTGGSFNVSVSNGTDTIVVRIDSDVDIAGMNAPTGTFDVTGLGSQFDDENPFDSGYQLQPRYVADIDPYVTASVTYPLRDIASVTTVDVDGLPDSLGINVELRGVVHGVDMQGTDNSNIQFTFIDQTGGISMFSSNDFGLTLIEGDEIAVQGVISQFRGLTQITPDTIMRLSTGNATVTPQIVTVLDESTESELIKIENVSLVDASQWAPDGSGFNVDVTDGTNTFNVRIDADTELFNMAAPTFSTFHVVGLGGQFDSSEPLTEGYQIVPRYAADIQDPTNTYNPFKANEVQLFPNPVQHQLSLNADISITQIRVFNLLGKVMLEIRKPNPSTHIDVEHLVPGTYLLQITNEYGRWATPIVKQ